MTNRMRRGRRRDLLLGYHDALVLLLRRRGQQFRVRVKLMVMVRLRVGVEGRYGHRGALSEVEEDHDLRSA